MSQPGPTSPAIPDEVPYDSSACGPDWDEALRTAVDKKHMTLRPIAGTEDVMVAGKCPRCNHDLYYLAKQDLITQRSLFPPGGRKRRPEGMSVTVSCWRASAKCTHGGADEERKKGCGFCGKMVFPKTESPGSSARV
jgi:hypothetical protein